MSHEDPILLFEQSNAGLPIPAVAASDFRRVWELMRREGLDGTPGIAGVENKVFENECSKGANVPAVWLRCGLLNLLLEKEPLTEWKVGGVLQDAVFETAATIEISGLRIDPGEFRRQLRLKTESE
jgi:hypothetical protein